MWKRVYFGIGLYHYPPMLVEMDFFLIALGLVGLVVVLIVVGSKMAKKRRAALAAAAGRLGFSYDPEKNRALGQEYNFLNALRQGDDRYAFDIMRGSHQGQEALVFGYHYETQSTDSQGNRTTTSHYLNVFTLAFPKAFPEMTIAREGFFSKVAQAFGYDDIDFESHEFSRIFCVRSKDKKFAYAICHPLAMEFLLANQDLNIEIEGDKLGFIFSGRLKPEDIERNLSRLLEFRQLVPEYLLVRENP